MQPLKKKKLPMLDPDVDPKRTAKLVKEVCGEMVQSAVKVYKRDGYLLPITFIFEADGEVQMLGRKMFNSSELSLKFIQAYAYVYKPVAVFMLSEGAVAGARASAPSKEEAEEKATFAVRKALRTLRESLTSTKAIVGLLQSKYINGAVSVNLTRDGDTVLASTPRWTEPDISNEAATTELVSNVALKPWWEGSIPTGILQPEDVEEEDVTLLGESAWFSSKTMAEIAARKEKRDAPTDATSKPIPQVTPNLIPCPACHGTCVNPKLLADTDTESSSEPGACPMCENGYIEVPT